MAAVGPENGTPPVVVESVGRVGVVRLDRPGKLNALDGPTISALRAAVARCAATRVRDGASISSGRAAPCAPITHGTVSSTHPPASAAKAQRERR